MARSRLLQVGEDGQVILPAEVRQRLGVDHGGTVALVETNDGVLIAREETIALAALDQIGAALAEQGVTLEELIESGREQ
jgi:AbrB family looped-hinge helix DNA binding protein